ncbi:MAG: protein kinase domain-containing protein [Gemmatimonadales bacterium]
MISGGLAPQARIAAAVSDRYRIERELGAGGMSRVFVATETALDRNVVIKILAPGLAEGLSTERFGREIQLAASLQQANIVPLLTAGSAGGVPYYVMPFVPGESLRGRLANTPRLGVTECVGILRDVARALSYAHERGVVHRDIKPDNVLLSHGAAMVTDFGIAKAVSAARTMADGDTLTQAGTSLGTPAYMSPEQVAGDPAIDHRADVYAWGCLAYELLTGAPPFVRDSAQRVLAAHLTEAPAPIGPRRADTPPALERLVLRCIAKEPASRPAAAELLRDLDDVFTPSGSHSPSSRPDASHAMQRRLLFGGLAIAAIGGAIVLMTHRRTEMIPAGSDVDVTSPGWDDRGHIVARTIALDAHIWRFRPIAVWVIPSRAHHSTLHPEGNTSMPRQFLTGSLLALALGATACAKQAAVVEVAGNCGDVYQAQVCTWAHTVGDSLVDVGTTVPLASIDGAPATEPMVWPPATVARLDMPASVQSNAGLTELTMYWEPTGHPPTPYLTPHFDFHFYVIPEAERTAITCADTVKPAALPAGYSLPDQPLPPDMAKMTGTSNLIGICIPGMGMHSLPTAELQGTTPFRGSMVVGYYHGRAIFIEPMLTKTMLDEKKSFDLPIPTIPGLSSAYPRTFHATWDTTKASYRFAYSDFASTR